MPLARASSDTTTITVSPSGGFSNSVTLSATGLPYGVSASFSPNPATSAGGWTSVLTLTAANDAAIGGPTTVTISGTDGTITRTTTIQLTVGAAIDFSLSANPTSITLSQAVAASASINISRSGGFRRG